tara:strand:- start:151 stop:681 length:531 start_codon:yes stop_codon:yes gene_type:complete
MIETQKEIANRLTVLARVGVKFIHFDLNKVGQEWVRQKTNGEDMSSIELITLFLSEHAHIANVSAHARLLKKIEDEQQGSLPLDFTQSFLNCEDTGENTNLEICLVKKEEGFDLKLLSKSVIKRYSVEKRIQISDLTLPHFKELIDAASISQSHSTVKCLIQWLADRIEVWGLAYG